MSDLSREQILLLIDYLTDDRKHEDASRREQEEAEEIVAILRRRLEAETPVDGDGFLVGPIANPAFQPGWPAENVTRYHSVRVGDDWTVGAVDYVGGRATWIILGYVEGLTEPDEVGAEIHPGPVKGVTDLSPGRLSRG